MRNRHRMLTLCARGAGPFAAVDARRHCSRHQERGDRKSSVRMNPC